MGLLYFQRSVRMFNKPWEPAMAAGFRAVFLTGAGILEAGC